MGRHDFVSKDSIQHLPVRDIQARSPGLRISPANRAMRSFPRVCRTLPLPSSSPPSPSPPPPSDSSSSPAVPDHDELDPAGPEPGPAAWPDFLADADAEAGRADGGGGAWGGGSGGGARASSLLRAARLLT
jgi:hypothetical protein